MDFRRSGDLNKMVRSHGQGREGMDTEGRSFRAGRRTRPCTTGQAGPGEGDNRAPCQGGQATLWVHAGALPVRGGGRHRACCPRPPLGRWFRLGALVSRLSPSLLRTHHVLTVPTWSFSCVGWRAGRTVVPPPPCQPAPGLGPHLGHGDATLLGQLLFGFLAGVRVAEMGIEVFIQDFRRLLVEIPSLPPAQETGDNTDKVTPSHAAGEKGSAGRGPGLRGTARRGWMPKPPPEHLRTRAGPQGGDTRVTHWGAASDHPGFACGLTVPLPGLGGLSSPGPCRTRGEVRDPQGPG